MAYDYLREQFDSTALTGWTADSWSVKGNALVRDSWISPDVLPDVAYYSNGITRGNMEIKANVWADQGGEIGLQVVTASGGTNGYEFRLNRNGSPHTVEIWKIVDDVYTQLASASAASITADRWIRLRGRLKSIDYDNWSAGVELSLYMDDEDTALITYNDRAQPTPRGDGYIGIRARSMAGIECKVDDVTLRRLMNVEVPDSYEGQLWSWGRLADHALMRLEGGGNPQFSRELMLDCLAWAENEIAMKAGEPYWLDRVYSLTTSSRLNDLPPWVGRVKEAYIDGQTTPIKIVPRSEQNIKEAARNKSGTVSQMTFMGVNDDGSMRYEIYPTPTGSTTLTLYVTARPGHIADDGQFPLVPPEHAEVLVLGALRRAFRYDEKNAATRFNDQLWAEGLKAIMRDHNRKANDGRRMISDNEYRKDSGGWTGLWYRQDRYVNP